MYCGTALAFGFYILLQVIRVKAVKLFCATIGCGSHQRKVDLVGNLSHARPAPRAQSRIPPPGHSESMEPADRQCYSRYPLQSQGPWESTSGQD